MSDDASPRRRLLDEYGLDLPTTLVLLLLLTGWGMLHSMGREVGEFSLILREWIPSIYEGSSNIGEYASDTILTAAMLSYLIFSLFSLNSAVKRRRSSM